MAHSSETADEFFKEVFVRNLYLQRHGLRWNSTCCGVRRRSLRKDALIVGCEEMREVVKELIPLLALFFEREHRDED